MIEILGGEGTIEKRIPAMFRMYMNYGIDMRKVPIVIYPTLHYQNGGLEINGDGFTKEIPNLLDVYKRQELERIMNAAGPTKGHLERLSDGKAPKEMVFIQCVGSRCADDRGKSYCSKICCMSVSYTHLNYQSRERAPSPISTI